MFFPNFGPWPPIQYAVKMLKGYLISWELHLHEKCNSFSGENCLLCDVLYRHVLYHSVPVHICTRDCTSNQYILFSIHQVVSNVTEISCMPPTILLETAPFSMFDRAGTKCGWHRVRAVWSQSKISGNFAKCPNTWLLTWLIVDVILSRQQVPSGHTCTVLMHQAPNNTDFLSACCNTVHHHVSLQTATVPSGHTVLIHKEVTSTTHFLPAWHNSLSTTSFCPGSNCPFRTNCAHTPSSKQHRFSACLLHHYPSYHVSLPDSNCPIRT